MHLFSALLSKKQTQKDAQQPRICLFLLQKESSSGALSRPCWSGKYPSFPFQLKLYAIEFLFTLTLNQNLWRDRQKTLEEKYALTINQLNKFCREMRLTESENSEIEIWTKKVPGKSSSIFGWRPKMHAAKWPSTEKSRWKAVLASSINFFLSAESPVPSKNHWPSSWFDKDRKCRQKHSVPLFVTRTTSKPLTGNRPGAVLVLLQRVSVHFLSNILLCYNV